MTIPSQGILPYDSVESFMNRGANGGLTCWYTGAANQTAHTLVAPSINVLYAYPVVLPGGIIDTVAFEVTTLGVGNGRVGIYSNTSEQILYPSSLVVDGGSQDVSSTGVKSTTGLTVAIAPGLYWFAHLHSVAATLRSLNTGALSHMLGLPPAMGSALNTRLAVSLAYTSLPTTFTAGALTATTLPPFPVAVHYAS